MTCLRVAARVRLFKEQFYRSKNSSLFSTIPGRDDDTLSTTSFWVRQCRQCFAAGAQLHCSSGTWCYSVVCSVPTADSRWSTWDANSRHPMRLFAAPARRSRAACTTAPLTSSAARDVVPPPRRLIYKQKREHCTGIKRDRAVKIERKMVDKKLRRVSSEDMFLKTIFIL